MRRLIYLLLLAIFVGASATCLSASTDCERWFVAYRQEVAHSRQLHRIAAAKRRAKLYARRKLAGYVKPKPRPHPYVHHGPRMTPRQTLRHFDLACGVLPEEEQDTPKIAEETPSDFQPGIPLGDRLDLLPADIGDTVAQNTVPQFETGTTGAPTLAGFSGFPPVFGGGYAPSGGGGYVPPGSGTAIPPNSPPSSGTPSGTPSGPPSSGPPGVPSSGSPPSGPPAIPPSGPPAAPPSRPPPPLPPPLAVVPEPGSYVFMLTGLAGAAGVIRRRFRA